jgi:hypothetical protein
MALMSRDHRAPTLKKFDGYVGVDGKVEVWCDAGTCEDPLKLLTSANMGPCLYIVFQPRSTFLNIF